MCEYYTRKVVNESKVALQMTWRGDYLQLSKWAHCNPKAPYVWEKRQERVRDMAMSEGLGLMLMALKMEEGGHESRKAGWTPEAGEGKERESPERNTTLAEETQPL